MLTALLGFTPSEPYTRKAVPVFPQVLGPPDVSLTPYTPIETGARRRKARLLGLNPRERSWVLGRV